MEKRFFVGRWRFYLSPCQTRWIGLRLSSWRMRFFFRWYKILVSKKYPKPPSFDYKVILVWRPDPRFIEVKLGKFYRCFKYGG